MHRPGALREMSLKILPPIPEEPRRLPEGPQRTGHGAGFCPFTAAPRCLKPTPPTRQRPIKPYPQPHKRAYTKTPRSHLGLLAGWAVPLPHACLWEPGFLSPLCSRGRAPPHPTSLWSLPPPHNSTSGLWYPRWEHPHLGRGCGALPAAYPLLLADSPRTALGLQPLLQT